MYFYLIGIDYKTAPLGIREYFYGRRGELIEFWKTETAGLLFTCNRIEIYATSTDAGRACGSLREFFRNFPEFLQSVYIKYGEKEVFRHALRLACGLESQLQGELQIFQQLSDWRMQEDLPYLLFELWGKVLSLAEAIRAQSGLDDNENNIANVVYYDLGKRLKSVGLQEVAIVGTGKMAQLLVQCRKPGLRLNFVAHKNYRKAQELAGISGGRVFSLKDLSCLLPKAAALICATGSPHYILRKEHFSNVSVPFYVYDLALPRDVDPAARDLTGVFLQDLDDLTGTIHLFNQHNQQKILLADRLADELTEEHAQAIYAENN